MPLIYAQNDYICHLKTLYMPPQNAIYAASKRYICRLKTLYMPPQNAIYAIYNNDNWPLIEWDDFPNATIIDRWLNVMTALMPR